MADSAKYLIAVQAGLIPGQADEEYSRRWSISSRQWEDAGKTSQEQRAAGREPVSQGELLATVIGTAQGYATLLMLQGTANWVTVEWFCV